MIVISSTYALAAAEAELSADHPVIGWRNQVTVSNIVATSALADYPASNLANPVTHLEWRSAIDTEQFLTVTLSEVGQIDYLAIARHNFGTAQMPVSVQGKVEDEWFDLVEETVLGDDQPLLFRFTAQSLSQIRLRLQEGFAAPRASVMYVGKLLVMERKIYVGHTPINHGRRSNVVGARSDSGNFLGNIVLGEKRETTIPLSQISPAWYRANMDPFLKDGRNDPFFFAWRPGEYPDEIGYCWLVEEPKPKPEAPSNRLAFDLIVNGVA